MDISEFNKEEEKPKNLMADFSTNVEEPKPLVNDATATNLAAHAAALAGPSKMKQTFDTVKDELNYGESNVINSVIDKWETEEMEYRRSALKSIITDPSIDSDTKADAVKNFNDKYGHQSMASRIGLDAAAADSDPEETASEEAIRFDISSWLDEFDVYNGMVQNEMNSIDKATPTRVDQDIEDFVLTFVPFYESYKFTELVDQIKAASEEEKPRFMFEAFLTLGHEKEEIRNAIQRMPVEKRTKVAKFILNYAKSDLNIHSMRGNKMLLMRNLEEMLGVGTYSDTDKWIDTVASAAETVLAAAPLLPAIPKGIKGAVKAGQRASRRGSDFARQKRYEDAVKRLEDKEATAAAAQKAEEAKQALKDAKTPEEKEAIIKSTGDAIAEDIIKDSPKKLGVEEATGIRSAVQVTAKELEVLEAGEFAGKVAELFKRVEGPKAIVEPPKKGFRLDVITDYIRSKVSPISISQVYKNTNPNKYRQLDQIIAKDPTDEAAQILTGTSRTDALVDARMPQVGKDSGAVSHKVDIYDGDVAGRQMIDDLKQSSGRLELSGREKQSLRSQVETDFKGVVGVNVNTAMTTIRHTDQGVKMSMAYSPKNSGFRSASRAKDDVVRALSRYGIGHEDVIIKKRNSDGTYTEVDKAKRGIKDYIATVDFDYNFSSTDLKNFDRTDTKWWSMFDVSLPYFGKLGIIPQSTMIDNLIFKSASVASDKTAFIQSKLLKYAQQYADSFNALDKRQQALVTDYIIEANEKGLKLDPTSLEVKGFGKKSIEALRQWRQVWDVLHHLDNWDLNKSLRAKGFERIVSKKGDIDLIATPAAKSSVNSKTRIYDPEVDAVRTITSQELDDFYEAGGSVFKTKTRIDIDEDSVEHVLVNQNNTYSRAIRDTDQTLPRREGYYKVDYKDPIFIEQNFKDADGVPYGKAIATAPTRTEALKYVENVSKEKNLDPEKDFLVRLDKRNSEGFEELEWSVAVNTGRTSQRVRGQRLADSRASSDVTMNHSHIESPEESLLKSIHSLSNRTAFRDWLDTSKRRFLDQFGHLLEKKGMWPEDVSLIKAKDIRTDPKEIRNAKSTWQYINTMENGYTDLLNDATKYLFKKMSDASGRAGFGWAETKLDQASDFNVNKWGRRKAFRIMIGSSVKQVFTQSSQVLPIVAALNPKFLPKVLPQLALLHGLEAGADAKSMLKLKAHKAVGISAEEAIEMEKHYRNSGIAESLSADTFVREHMHSLIDRTKAQKFNTALDKPIDFLQKIGFETGTNILMKSVWLSEYDLLRKAGTKITPEVLDELGAKVRALTADENRAGEMAYSQNMFSTVTQFLATRHKMFSQMILGHRGLTKTEMNKLRASYLLTYGAGYGPVTALIYNLYRDMFGEEMPEEIRHGVEGGVFQATLNKALSILTGQDVNVAFSESFRIGIEQPNIWRFVEDMVDLNVPSMISNSPAGSLVFGDSPKFTTFVNETMRMFTVPEYETKEQAFTAAKSFLTMFPTASASLKAYYILKWAEEHEGKGRSIGRSGVIHDYDVNTVEALMKIAGFSTMDELMSYRLNEDLYRQGSEPWEDVKKIVNEVNVRTAMDGVARGDPENAMSIVREVQRVFQDHPVYNKIMISIMKKQAEDTDNNLIRKLMTIAQTSDEDSLENLLRSTQLSENQKEFLRDLQRTLGKE